MTFDKRGGELLSRKRLDLRLVICALPTIFIAQGCSMRDLNKEHAEICEKNMKIIIHSKELWDEYKEESIAAHRKELLENPPRDGRTFTDPVDDFSFWSGTQKTFFRGKIKENEIVREDVFLMKGGQTTSDGQRLVGGKIVAQFVDYIAFHNPFGGPTSFTCMKYYRRDLKVGTLIR